MDTCVISEKVPKLSSDTLIAIGSNNIEHAKIVENYSPENNVWSKLLNLDVDRSYFRCVMLDEKLMIVGGLSNSSPSANVQSYDFATGKITNLAPLNTARLLFGIAVLSRHLYVSGGASTGYLDSVERYDPVSNRWTEIAPLLKPRNHGELVVLDGEIYVIGGYYMTMLSDVESYNPVRGSWKKCAPMNDIRDDPAVAAIGKFIYVVGGYSLTELLNSAERYEPLTDRWTYVQSMTVPRLRCRGIYFNDAFIVAGGELVPNSNSTPVVESYNVEQNKWNTIASLVYPRAHFSLVEVPWKLTK